MTLTAQIFAPQKMGPAHEQTILWPGGKALPQTAGSLALPQSCYGNQAMLKLVARGVLQRKLTINRPGDIYEQEADRVADSVMRMPDPAAASQRVTSVGPAVGLQRCSCGQSSSGGQCEECKSKVMALQRISNGSASGAGATAPAIVHDVLRSPGQRLDAATRSFMEPRFGHSFGSVRVHTDDRAAESARAVNALAYTVGRDLVFGAGQYAPQTQAGSRLLAHELTHVLQSRGPSTPSMVQRTCSPPQKRVGSSADEGQKPGAHALNPCRWLLFGFHIGSSEFMPQFTPAVNQLVNFLSQHESAKLRLIGLTDCFGTDATNRSIATARSQNVKNAFPAVFHSRIELLPSNGKTFVVSNETREKRSINRSVQVEIVPPKDAECPKLVGLKEQIKPTIMRGKCGGKEETLLDAVRGAVVLGLTALSRARNWRHNKKTRGLIDVFYGTRNDRERQEAADKISADLGSIIPHLRSPVIECLLKGDPGYDTICSETTIAEASGASVIRVPTFCFPQFVTIPKSLEIQASVVLHEFAHRFGDVDDMGLTYYETNTCAATEKTAALTRTQRLRHADTLSCFATAAALQPPQ